MKSVNDCLYNIVYYYGQLYYTPERFDLAKVFLEKHPNVSRPYNKTTSHYRLPDHLLIQSGFYRMNNECIRFSINQLV